ncbi:hypothetical protein [Glycomyces salinus]|nr:hypothetical protein [Glycomyces salinus]
MVDAGHRLLDYWQRRPEFEVEPQFSDEHTPTVQPVEDLAVDHG